jgi:copper chaperone CopZ
MSGTKETVLEIVGMSCSSCVRHVEGALRKLDGVESVEVTLANGRARVRHDPERVSADRMIAAVDDAGYESKVLVDQRMS